MSDCELRSDGIDDVLHDSHSGNRESFRSWTIDLGGCWSCDLNRCWAELNLEPGKFNGPSSQAINSVQLKFRIAGPVNQIGDLRNLRQILNGWSKEGKGCGRSRIWRG